MADCELCGAMKVGVRHVKMGKAEVAACARCTEKMNLGPKETAPGLSRVQPSPSTPSLGFAAKGKRGKDIMLKSEKELAGDFAARISTARKSKGWNQSTLGKRMAETVNIIKSTESGKRPTDSVLKKFERVLGISLFVSVTASETRQVANPSSRGMTLGDYLDDMR